MPNRAGARKARILIGKPTHYSSRYRFLAVFSLLLVCAVLCTPAYGKQPHSKRHSTKAAKATPPPIVQPTGPLSPLPLAQTPALPAQVTYQNNQLTIVALNSTLGDILRAVRTRTGAVVEIPANANERVMGQFGPASARDVLVALLNGSNFNYVLLGSAKSPNAVEHVILTSKTSGVPNNGQPQNPAMQAGIPQRFPNQMNLQQPPTDAQDQQDMSSNDDASDDEPLNSDQNQANQTPPQPANGQPEIKTPEQLLQELQRQQQLLQQQQQQQSGAPQGPPPGSSTSPSPANRGRE